MKPSHERQAIERFNPHNQRAKFAAQRAKILEVRQKNPEMSIDAIAARVGCSRKMVNTTLADAARGAA